MYYIRIISQGPKVGDLRLLSFYIQGAELSRLP